MQLKPSVIADFKAGRLDTFYAEAYADLLTFAARQLGESHALMAEDVVQEVIFQSYQRRAGISDSAQWKAFLFRSIHNAAVSIRRKHASEQRYLNQHREDAEDLEHSIVEQETLECLFDAIDALPERYRRIFDLSFEKGLRNTEVAELLNVSTRAVTKQKARMIELVKKHMRKQSE